MRPTREETLQAERDAAVGALADAVRKARDVALEEAAEQMAALSVVAQIYERKRAFADAASSIRALKSKP